MNLIKQFTKASFEQIKRSDKLAWFNTIATIIIGIWGILLAKQGLKQAEIASSQEQSIKGWNTLIKYQSAQDSSLKDALIILSNQLLLNEQAQREANKILNLNKGVGVSRLKLAVIKFSIARNRLIPNRGNYRNIDSVDREKYLNNVKDILQGEFDNRFLFDNDSLSNKWVDAYIAVGKFQKSVTPMSQEVSQLTAYYSKKLTPTYQKNKNDSLWVETMSKMVLLEDDIAWFLRIKLKAKDISPVFER